MVYEGKTGCHDMLCHRSQPEINVIAVLCSTVQYSTVQYSTVQYSTVQYSTVQYSTIQYSTVQCSAVHHITLRLRVQYQ